MNVFSANTDNLEGAIKLCPICHEPIFRYKRISPTGDGQTIVVPCYMKCKCDKNYERRLNAATRIQNRKAMFICGEDWQYGQGMTFSNWNTGHDALRTFLEAYCEHFNENQALGYGFILSGKNGSGKTYALMAVANFLIDKGFAPLWLDFGLVLETRLYDLAP